MAIYFDEEKKIFYLESGCVSYVMQISQFGFLTQLYYGKRIPREDVSYVEKLYDRGSEAVVFGAPSRRYSPNVITSEYPSYGKGDFRECAFIPRGADGFCRKSRQFPVCRRCMAEAKRWSSRWKTK